MAPHGPVLTWNDSFVSGVPEIDEQHMILVDLLNVVSVKRASDLGVTLTEQIILDLLNYAIYHFETEEQLMQQYGYAESAPEEATRHLEQHRLFSAHMAAARDNLKAGETVPLDNLVVFLREWLQNHILHTDFQLGAFIRSKRDTG
jgi:hemerythrin